MVKQFKKILSGLMICCMVSGMLPSVASANRQTAVNDLAISDFTSRDQNDYNIRFTWSQPYISAASESGVDDPMGLHAADYYDIYYRNLTKAANNNIFVDTVTQVPGVDTNSYQNNISLIGGSLYAFRVFPYHYHKVTQTTGQQTLSIRSTIDPATKEMEYLYLTDIAVQAEGAGNKMTVTWDYPTFGGRDLFDGYRIYYAQGGASLAQIAPNSTYVDAMMSDPGTTVTKDGRLEYTFQDDNLAIGVFYAVKIEPLYNGVPLRLSSIKNVRYANVDYPISYTDPTLHEYRTNLAYVRPSLYVRPEGVQFVLLYWDNIVTPLRPIKTIDLYSSSTENFEIKTWLGSLSGDVTLYTNSWVTQRPTAVTYYKMTITFTDGSTMDSIVRVFDPATISFAPYRPNILQITDAPSPISMEVTWAAFLREAFNDEEKKQIDPTYNRYVDRNVIYDIWVTDDIENYNNPLFAKEVLASVNASNLALKNIAGAGAFSTQITQYISINESGMYDKKSLEGNKIYYFKIVARRGATDEESKPEYSSHYIPPVDGIDVTPNMMARPPLRILTDVNGVEQITENTIGITWDTKWYEAFDAVTNRWYSKIGVDSTGLKFGDDADTCPDIIMLNQQSTASGGENEIKSILSRLGISGLDIPPLRLIDITDCDYEIHVAEFEYVTGLNSFESYINDVLNNDDSLWTKISPSGDPDHPEFIVTQSIKPNNGNLINNKAYVVFFRPYTETDGHRAAYYPSYVTATTAALQPPLVITPTVPVLTGVSSQDCSLTVRWDYSQELCYELRYGDRLALYPDQGIAIGWNTIQQTAILSSITDQPSSDFITFEITGLFPETSYYIWVRAYSMPSGANNSAAQTFSAWSNPLLMSTTEIVPPKPPQGLGLASKDDIDAYNKINNLQLSQLDYNYMIIQWLKDVNDSTANAENTPADNTANTNTANTNTADTQDNVELLENPDSLLTYMVKFNNLIANRPYYIRAKTILTVAKSSDGIIKTYSYVVQLSPTDDFADFIEITVPIENSQTASVGDGIDLTNPANYRQKESGWTNVLILYTGVSSGEYDGSINPHMYPLAASDYEIIYNSTASSLYYRFRSNGADAFGNNDNFVDQRFITKLIDDKVFTYELDMSKYYDKKISTRTLELPYSIFAALDGHQISLKLVADNFSIVLPPQSIKTSKAFGKDSKVIITLTQNGYGALSYEEEYVSKPHKLNIQIYSASGSEAVGQLNDRASISLKLNSRTAVLDKSITACISDNNTGGWQRVSSSYNNVEGSLSFNTNRIASYAAIASKSQTAVNASGNYAAADSFYEISSKIVIKDLSAYNPDAIISANQFNNLVAAVAKGADSVTINTQLSAPDYESLGKSGLLVSGSYVTNEAGISSLVKLYELKTGYRVKSYPTVAESSLSDISSVSLGCRESVLKAEKLSFISGSVRPGDYMTVGEAFIMIAEIVKDRY